MTAKEKRERWVAIGAVVANGNPRQYTNSELDSVLIGVRAYDKGLAAKIAAMIKAKGKS
jgi:hypothetical protein